MHRLARQRAALGSAIIAALVTAAKAEPVVTASPHSVAVTMDRLETDARARGLIVVARVDHAANATSAGLSLRPMQLLIFGNPAAGTKLIEAAPLMGLSLPLKMLAWQEADGTTRLAYDSAGDLAAGRGVPADFPILPRVQETMQAMTRAATRP